MTTTETAPAIVPQFGDETPAGRKLAIICSKGTLDMAYPGLMLANAALGEGVETHLFFTFWGFDMINKKPMGDLKFTVLGNTPRPTCPRPRRAPGDDRDGDGEDEEADRRRRRARGARIPGADRRLRRAPVGLPDVGRHEPPDQRRPLRRRSRTSSAPATSSRRPKARNCCSSKPSPRQRVKPLAGCHRWRRQRDADFRCARERVVHGAVRGYGQECCEAICREFGGRGDLNTDLGDPVRSSARLITQ